MWLAAPGERPWPLTRHISSLHCTTRARSSKLKTIDLSFLAALYGRENEDGLTSIGDDKVVDVFAQVCELVEPDPDNVRRRATHAIQRLRDQKLLARIDGTRAGACRRLQPHGTRDRHRRVLHRRRTRRAHPRKSRPADRPSHHQPREDRAKRPGGRNPAALGRGAHCRFGSPSGILSPESTAASVGWNANRKSFRRAYRISSRWTGSHR